MSECFSLLKEEPHILTPDIAYKEYCIILHNNRILSLDIDLTKNIAKCKVAKETECEKCGKHLKFPYYLLVGIPPSSSIIDSVECNKIDDEGHGIRKIIDEIRFEGEQFDIEIKHKWIFSDQNITNSKTRLCIGCYYLGYKKYLDEKDFRIISIRIREVYYAVQEYQRRNTPINSATSELERYRISLPDRSMVACIDPGIPGYGFWLDECTDRGAYDQIMSDYLSVALIPDYNRSTSMLTDEGITSLLKELRTEFIQDKNRLVPNDQELTRWIKKYYSDHEEHSYIKAIEFCKVFPNPKTNQFDNHVFKTKYSAFVHYIDKDWEEFYI